MSEKRQEAEKKAEKAAAELEGLVAEFNYLRSLADGLQRSIEILNTALSEIFIAKSTLEEVKKAGVNSEILVPSGAGSFTRAEVKDASKVFLNLGAGYVAELPVEDAISKLDERAKQVQERLSQTQNQLVQVVNRMNAVQQRINELYSKLGGRETGVQ
ncbi:MAG: prefoldin subunit alpha [Candidatus Verstraetearchaeota archaeon]|nr:prefoldin subunit alpha [Candidatus Verstraetearchaeota archaeon]